MTTLTEADLERAALDWLGVGWRTTHGPDIAPDTPNAEHSDYGQWSWSVGCGTPDSNISNRKNHQ